jgi:hypothetical protein
MDKKKVLGSIGIALVGVSAGAIGMNFLYNSSQQIAELNAQVAELNTKEPVVIEVPVIVEKEVIKEVPVEKVVEKIVTQNVTVEDTELLQKLCNKLVYEDIEECRKEVNAEDYAIELAKSGAESKLAEALDDEGIVDKERYAKIQSEHKTDVKVDLIKLHKIRNINSPRMRDEATPAQIKFLKEKGITT